MNKNRMWAQKGRDPLRPTFKQPLNTHLKELYNPRESHGICPLEHNIFLCNHAMGMGLKWEPYHGVTRVSDFELLASETEEDIFKVLDLPFINPEDREKGN